MKQPQRQQPADQRRRQRGEHRDRVQVAFVQDRQDHVHHEDGQDHQDRQVAHGLLEREGFALEVGAHGAAERFAAAVLSMKSVASPSDTPGMRLKLNVTLVNWLRWLTDCGPIDVCHLATALSGTVRLAVVGLM